MTAIMLGLLAEAHIHPGSGRSLGGVDLPVSRENPTDYPVIYGSGLKGALRDRARGIHDLDEATVFGSPNGAGEIMVAEARLLLLPVRCLTGTYRWATCPLIIERLRRDLARSALQPIPDQVSSPQPGEVHTEASGEQKLMLEERTFQVTGTVPSGLVEALTPLIRHEDVRKRLASQVAILHDDDFSWFARYALPVVARNQLEEGSKRSRNLWYEEALPPDTLLAAIITARPGISLDAIDQLFDTPYLQVGGNETVGQGWMSVSLHKGDSSGSN